MADTTILPLSATQPSLPPGQTVLAIGIVPGLSSSVYGVPYPITSLTSAGTLFGNGRYVRGLGELMRQNAPAILGVALAQESDLASLFDYMVDQAFDIVVPIGLTATASRLQTFGQFSFLRGQRSNPITLVMAADPSPGVSSLTSSPLGAQAGQVGGVGDPQPMQLGRNVVLTLDQLIINPNVPSQYQADAAPSVAGLIARTPPSASITNQTLLGCTPVTPLYSSTDASALAKAGYCVLRQSPRRGLVIYQGVTATSTNPADPNYSPNFHNLATIRAANFVELTLSRALDSTVGAVTSSTLRTFVSGLMDDLKRQGVILAYDLDLSINQVGGSVAISLAILPPFETTWITVSTQVNLPKV